MAETADVVVIGLGPGGEDAASRLAEAGLDVVGVEAELLGGECPYWGCVPSKMIVRGADLLQEGRRIETMAGSSTVRPGWAPVAARIREATDTWDDTVAVKRFEAKGGRFVRGWGRLDGPGRVVVGDRAFEARRAVVVGTGTRAAIPPIDGLAATPYWTNRQAIEAEQVPASIIVIGGGAIGVELAQAFSRFGAAVTVLEAAPRVVVAEEPEASTVLTDVLRNEGIVVEAGVAIESVSHDGAGFAVAVAGRDAPYVAERLLVATGRRVDLATLATATVGIPEDARALPVDDHLRVTGVERTWALGDVTGKGAFTHVSMYQANIVVNDVLGRDVAPADYRALPRVTFTDPEIGSVGMSEAAARAAGIEVRTGEEPVAASARGWIHKAGNEGFIKVVEDATRGVLVGATSMGPWGGEVLGLLSLAVHAAVPTETLLTMIYAYPTFHRGIESALKKLA